MFTYVSNYMSGTRQDSGDIEVHLLDLDPVLMRLIGYCTYRSRERLLHPNGVGWACGSRKAFERRGGLSRNLMGESESTE